MSDPVKQALITRPEDDAPDTVRALSAIGVEGLIAPLLTVQFDTTAAVDLSGVQGLLFTSANGARALAERTPERALPVFAVGDATARKARDLGFAAVHSAGGDVADLAALVVRTCKPEGGALFHGAGKVTAGDLSGALEAAGFTVRKAKLYGTRKAGHLPKIAADALKTGTADKVLVYSPRTAETFAALIRKAGLEKSLEQVTVYCLSSAVADRLTGLPFKAVRIAEKPEQDALIQAIEADKAIEADGTNEEKRMTDDAKDAKKESPAKADTPAKDTPAKDTPAHDKPKDPPKAAPKAEAPKVEAPKAETPKAHAAKPSEAKSEAKVELKAEKAKTVPPKKGGGFKRFVFLIVVLVVVGSVGYATLPQWREQVPEPLRGLLPTLPMAQATQDRMAQLADQMEAQSQALADLQQRVGGLATLAAGLNDRLDAIEAKQGEIANKAETLSAVSSVDPQEVVELRKSADQTAALSAELLDRLQQLEGKAVDPAQMTALADRMDALDKAKVEPATLLNLSERVAAMDAKVADAVGQRDAIASYILAVAQLRNAVSAGQPFDAELRTVKVLAVDGGNLETAVAPVASYAQTGVPTLGTLRVRFTDVAKALNLVAAAPQAESGSMTKTVLNRLSGLVSITRTDGTASGSGPAAVAARASALLQTGDLAGAVAEIGVLDGLAAEKAAAWLADAKARLAADQAMSELTADALALSAKKGQ